ncbi:UNVERIFIED_CONTAM: hypothetical protein PYX00_005580 [Menopon gallinae]|uniref:MD-2-related lipid-recognition domain-containing protein n=1 Tax=Menopon gallinae TaxID=328185 RepID=A0AAW2HSR2_9NEOP
MPTCLNFISLILKNICLIVINRAINLCAKETTILESVRVLSRTMAGAQFSIFLTGMIILAVVSARREGYGSFWWRNCGDSTDPIKVSDLDVFVNGSDYIYVTGKGEVGFDLQSPIQGKVTMKKKSMGIWWPIPCVDKLGSCSYHDVCTLTPFPDDCPKVFTDNHIPCHCPVSKGHYSVQNLPLDINILPHALEKGTYSATVRLSYDGEQILCLKMTIDII